MCVLLLGILFYCLSPTVDTVNEQSIQRIKQGMTKTEVNALLGLPVEERMMTEGLSVYFFQINPNESVQSWCRPGCMAYRATIPNTKNGLGWVRWVSSTHFVSIQFQEDRVVEVWSAPAKLDEGISGTLSHRLSEWWDYQRSRFR